MRSLALCLLLLCSWFPPFPVVAQQRPDPILPNLVLTPGDTNAAEGGSTDQTVVCSRRTYTVRNVSEATKRQVFAEYGITDVPHQYEVDHLISLELGGSNDIKNLWPQSYVTTPWNAHVKDKLEDWLHAQVCFKGTMTLAEAQSEIATDWIQLYTKEFGTP